MTKTTSDPYAEIERGDGELTIHLFTPPVPASRPRVSKWGTYYGKTYKAYRKAAETAIPQTDEPVEGLTRVVVEFICKRPKKTVRRCPAGDIDNHLKSILDAITRAGYIEDDELIVGVKALKRWAHEGETPHTYIRIIAT